MRAPVCQHRPTAIAGDCDRDLWFSTEGMGSSGTMALVRAL
jgi:hypothetical protein